MARPKKTGPELKPIGVRVTKELKEDLEKVAKYKGMPLAIYLRTLLKDLSRTEEFKSIIEEMDS